MMLETIPGLLVIGESSSKIIHTQEENFPPADIVFLDVHLRNANSFDLTRNLHNLFPWMKIVMLSMFSEPGYATDGKQAGAAAVILKSVVCSTLITILQELFPGEFIPAEEHSRLTSQNT